MPRTPYYVPLFVTFKAASPALIDLTFEEQTAIFDKCPDPVSDNSAVSGPTVF